MGEKGTYPQDYWEILVCPYHVYGWDFEWDHQGERVFAVQGGQILDITLEDNSTIGVHFFVVDKRSDGWFAADYGHVNVYSLAENGFIHQDDVNRILRGEQVDGGWVREGQLLGATGDDCCTFGVLHISTAYNLWGKDPAVLWELGTWPDFSDSRPREAGGPVYACGP